MQLPCLFFIAVLTYSTNEFLPTDWEHDPEFMDTKERVPGFHMQVLAPKDAPKVEYALPLLHGPGPRGDDLPRQSAPHSSP